ncbi:MULTISPECIES: trypsin-like peptidase domain-containing protein [Microvirga]|uniref:trypsin-like peptidase domain-containing protein n=1 Tax=Microvirga TaxID=186650 RepID=UPI0016824479|nr:MULTISPECIES: trypsin-like peptidase domain-containing protein [Microvirga]MBD2750934.1 trypsin-like peptidase domain-containing protein [Microvirga sp.]
MPDFHTEEAKGFLGKILTPDGRESGGLESLTQDAPALEDLALEELVPARSLPQEQIDLAERAATKLSRSEEMAPDERFALEAIIIPDKRPAIDIIRGDYHVTHHLWLHFNKAPIKEKLRRAIPSIGRIELPHHPTLPYGGTGFVVGDGLLMTNRHVAQIFASGIGIRDLVFLSGYEAGIDFVRERDSTVAHFLAVKEVAMVHPYWDMALLQVESLSSSKIPSPLTLSLKDPVELYDRDVAVIGYPAFDPRNDAAIQNTVFNGIYYIKRLQPGKIRERRSVESFRNMVSAVTHDSSTLGGNSGSAVVDSVTGEILGLHFAGVYLDANFAVPTFELARDSRVVDAGVNFQSKPRSDPGAWVKWWSEADVEGEATKKSEAKSPPTANPLAGPIVSVQAAEPAKITLGLGDSSTWTLPIEISIRVGEARGLSSGETPQSAPSTQTDTAAEQSSHEPQGRTRPVRNAQALRAGPMTFRDHFASLFQSAVADLASRTPEPSSSMEASGLESLPLPYNPADAADLILAAEKIAQIRTSNAPNAGLGLEPMSYEEMPLLNQAQACASLAWQLMQAKVLGDTAGAAQLEAQITGGTCDPRWAQTITEYVKYFGPNGSRREPLYVKPDKVKRNVIEIEAGSRIALIGDWGTGAQPARCVLEQARDQHPDIVVHLGDIYYSGTEKECQANFQDVVNEVFDRANSHLPIYTLCGNHDMYCGGGGYYGLLKSLNKGAKRQEASFFCLRASDESWQLLGLDTGRNDYSPFSVTDAVTFVEEVEEEWHRNRIQEFPGKTILLSHHQLFSAFSQIGGRQSDGTLCAYNPRLKAMYERLLTTGRSIPAWFWGHEHNLCIYRPYLGLPFGRCVGHSAIPVFANDEPYKPLGATTSLPEIFPETMLSVSGDFYTHGFALLTLESEAVQAEYFEDLNGALRCLYSERIH